MPLVGQAVKDYASDNSTVHSALFYSSHEGVQGQEDPSLNHCVLSYTSLMKDKRDQAE